MNTQQLATLFGIRTNSTHELVPTIGVSSNILCDMTQYLNSINLTFALPIESTLKNNHKIELNITISRVGVPSAGRLAPTVSRHRRLYKYLNTFLEQHAHRSWNRHNIWNCKFHCEMYLTSFIKWTRDWKHLIVYLETYITQRIISNCSFEIQLTKI